VLDPNVGSTVILQNSGNCLSSDTASHPKKLVSSAALLGEPEILHEAETSVVESLFVG